MKSLLILALLASNSWSLDQKLGVVTIVEGAVTTSKLAQDAVTEAKILTGSVTTAKVAAGAITTSKLAADPLTVDGTNGRIGIRLSAPLASLSVNGASGSGPTATDKGIAQILSAADAIGMSVGAYSGSPYPLYIQGHDPRSGQNSTYPLSLNPIGGNVGIGTTNPGNKLHVVGSGVTFENTTSDINVDIGGSGTSLARFTYDNTNNILNMSVFEGGAEGAKLTIESGSGGGVGIGTTNPTSKFQVDAGTFSVYSTGIVDAPGQPFVVAAEGAADVFTNGVASQMFFQAPAAGNDPFSMWGGAASSGTFTIPTNGSGKYALNAQTFITLVGTVCIVIRANGSDISADCGYDSSGNYWTPSTDVVRKLSAGDVLTAFVTQTSGAAQSPDSVALSASYFSAVKIP